MGKKPVLSNGITWMPYHEAQLWEEIKQIAMRIQWKPYLEEGKQMQWEKEVRKRVQKDIEDAKTNQRTDRTKTTRDME